MAQKLCHRSANRVDSRWGAVLGLEPDEGSAMNGTQTRRQFFQVAGGGLLLAPALMRAQSSTVLTAREVVARIKRNVGVPWRTPTADEFKIGDPDAPIRGITTTFMSTLDVLRRSAAVGNNFVITHEPTAADRRSTSRVDMKV